MMDSRDVESGFLFFLCSYDHLITYNDEFMNYTYHYYGETLMSRGRSDWMLEV